MSKSKSGMILATAVAGLIATTTFAQSAQTTQSTTTTTTTTVPAVQCLGINSCKGQGACKTASNACKGLNACKGQGVIATTAANCQQQGGTVAQ